MHHKGDESNAVSFSVAKINFLLFLPFVSHVAKGGMAHQYRRRLFLPRGSQQRRVIIHHCLAVLQQAWKKLRHGGTMNIPLCYRWRRFLITSVVGKGVL